MRDMPWDADDDEGAWARPWIPEDGDTRCQQCGLPNPVWWADNDDWNRLMPQDGVLCPTCYHRLWIAEQERGNARPQEAE